MHERLTWPGAFAPGFRRLPTPLHVPVKGAYVMWWALRGSESAMKAQHGQREGPRSVLRHGHVRLLLTCLSVSAPDVISERSIHWCRRVLPSCGRRQRRACLVVAVCLGLLLLCLLLFSAPWWWPWLLWRSSTTSFVRIGPGMSSLHLPLDCPQCNQEPGDLSSRDTSDCAPRGAMSHLIIVGIPRSGRELMVLITHLQV